MGGSCAHESHAQILPGGSGDWQSIWGRKPRRRNFYQESIQLANQNGYIQDEALANELYAKFWLAIG